MRLGLVALLSGLGVAAAAPAQPRPARPVFACGFGARQVRVTGSPQGLTYRFGTATTAEMTLTAGPQTRTVFQKTELFARAVNRHLRFTQGAFSYVLFHREYFGTATHKGAEDVQGLLVLKGPKLLAKMTCRSGPGFGDADLSALPEDAGFDLADHM